MRATLLIAAFLAALAPCVSAQPGGGRISGATVHEIRGGKVPFADSTNQATSYNQINLAYVQGDVQAGIRAEVYRTTLSDGTDSYSVTHLSQKYLRWTHGPAELVAGNYYAILGRGLTLRAFEAPGMILEDRQFRRRYAPSRDLDGGMVTWSQGFLFARALIGQPVISDLPPDAPGVDRRDGWVSGGEVTVRPHPALRIGATALNLRPADRDAARPEDTDDSWAWSWLAGVDVTDTFLSVGLESVYGEIYGEFAERAEALSAGHARYVSGNFGIGAAGLSVEYKDYDNFSLKVNDPPQLVREHSSYLMNRSTHVAEPFGEKGWQVEGYAPLVDGLSLTGNVAWAKNPAGPTRSFHFNERYLRLDIDPPSSESTVGTYFGWGRDEVDARASLRTGGIVVAASTASGNRLELNAELQRGKLSFDFGNGSDYWDSYFALSLQSPRGFGVALVMDRTTDPLETDNPDTFPALESDPLSYWSLNANASLGRFEATVFAGERRGGTACTGGVCYQVLPFKGVELRLQTRI